MKKLTGFIPASALAIACTLLPAGCGKAEPARAPEHPVRTIADFFEVGIGPAKARLQFAISEAEQQRGLMFRTDLGENDGMIFVYAAPQPMSFWMRNTPTPLDIGFFDREGVLQEVHHLLPRDETPIHSRSSSLQYAVEMSQGWYAAHGVQRGAKLDLKAVAEALRARGQEPRRFGLDQRQ